MGDVVKVLKQAMSTEIWGKRFYEQAVARTEAEDGKKVFQSLVEEETKHLDVLRGQYAAVTGSNVWVSVDEAVKLAASVSPTDIFPDAGSIDDLIPAGSSDEQAIEMAMAFEQRGFNLYDEAGKAAASPEEKAIWEWLAKAEDIHYGYLQEELEYLKTNGAWYFDEQELPFFEG
jgi:rubrerythrin